MLHTNVYDTALNVLKELQPMAHSIELEEHKDILLDLRRIVIEIEGIAFNTKKIGAKCYELSGVLQKINPDYSGRLMSMGQILGHNINGCPGTSMRDST